MRRPTTVLVTLMASAAACATIPADAPAYHRAPAPDAGMANVYVYRSQLEAECQKIGAPALFVDGKPIYNVVEGAYTVVPLPEGTHKLKLYWGVGACPDLEFYFSVEAGQSRYVRFVGTWRQGSTWDNRPAWVGTAKAEELTADVAEPELARCCRFLPADKLPANISPRDRLITGR